MADAVIEARVEVTQEQVNVVFRVDSYQEESDPEKKSLQLCSPDYSPSRKIDQREHI